MSKLGALVLAAGLIFSTGLPVSGQSRSHNSQQRSNNTQSRPNSRTHFYDGANQGVRGGSYYSPGRDDHGGYRNNQNNQGGIGPGKGALIGGAAGATLGALFGGGVKGSLITGAAGAGIGAVIGQSAQDNRDRNNYRR